MKHIWETTADALRNEIAEYGRLIQLFEEQQRLIFRGAATDVMDIGDTIQAQLGAVTAARGEREKAMSAFALANGQPMNATLRSLLPFYTAEARPLMAELIANVNLLIHRVRRGSQQNHRLLLTTVATHQELLRRLWPDNFTKTYAPDGRVSVASLRAAPAIKSAG